MTKNLQYSPCSPTFCDQRSIKKLEAKKSKFYFHNFWGNIVSLENNTRTLVEIIIEPPLLRCLFRI